MPPVTTKTGDNDGDSQQWTELAEGVYERILDTLNDPFTDAKPNALTALTEMAEKATNIEKEYWLVEERRWKEQLAEKEAENAKLRGQITDLEMALQNI